MEEFWKELGIYLCGGAALLVIFFFIGREIVCWYFKYNEVVSLLERIDNKLAGLSMPSASNEAHPIEKAEVDQVSDRKENCPFCNELSLITNKVCENCGKKKK